MSYLTNIFPFVYVSMHLKGIFRKLSISLNIVSITKHAVTGSTRSGTANVTTSITTLIT